jgi:hypothetical protein
MPAFIRSHAFAPMWMTLGEKKAVGSWSISRILAQVSVSVVVQQTGLTFNMEICWNLLKFERNWWRLLHLCYAATPVHHTWHLRTISLPPWLNTTLRCSQAIPMPLGLALAEPVLRWFYCQVEKGGHGSDKIFMTFGLKWVLLCSKLKI